LTGRSKTAQRYPNNFFLSPFKTITVFILMAFIGIAVIPFFSVDLKPSYRLPAITISYLLPDSSPEMVEQEATAPIENVMSQISGVQKIHSTSGYNQGTIELTFDKSTDIDFKKFEITSLIRQLYPTLNPLLSYPVIEQRSLEVEERKVLLLYRVSSKLSSRYIGELVSDRFVNELSQLKGIKEIQVAGVVSDQITISYDPQKIKQFGVEPVAIQKKLVEMFSAAFPGQLELASGQKMILKVANPLDSVQQIEDALVPIAGKTFVRLKQLADIIHEEASANYYFRVNGLNSVTVGLYADPGINRIALSNVIKERIVHLKTVLTDEVKIDLDYDDTAYLTKEINKNYLRASLAIAILLVFLLLSYRNWRYLIILFLGVLVSLCLTMMMAYFLEVSMHIYSIAGITISFGMMTDNSIIMLDQLIRKRSKNVFKSILVATLSTIVALLLIFALPEEDRQNLEDFSVVVAIALMASLLVSFFLIPSLFKLFFEKNGSKILDYSFSKGRRAVNRLNRYQVIVNFIARFRGAFIALLIFSFGIPVFLLPSKIDDAEWYNRTIGSSFYQEKIRPVSDKIVGGAWRLFVRHVYEGAVFRDHERTRLFVHAELSIGHTLEDMNTVIRSMEVYLENEVGVDKFISDVSSNQFGIITITFKDDSDSEYPYRLKSKLIALSLSRGGVKWNIFGVGQGFSSSNAESIPNFQVKLKGYNYDQLEANAMMLREKLVQHERVQNVNTNEKLRWNERSGEQVVLELQTGNLASLGINNSQIVNFLKKRSNPQSPSMYLPVGESLIPVFFTPVTAKSFSTHALLHERVSSDSISVKLTGSATLEREKTTGTIHKENRQYIRIVSFDYFGSQHFGNKFLDEVLISFKDALAPGNTAEKTSWSFSWEKAGHYYSLLALLIAAVYALCVCYYGNFQNPLYVIISIPISFIGLFLTFYLFEIPFDQGGYAAFVMLGGLVVNAGVFVTYDLSISSTASNRQICKSVFQKIRPVSLTVISTCLGLTPFLIGGENEIFWYALASGVIGGFVFSLCNMFFIIPALLLKKETHK
jgi:multidrug efflux pump subunit AcrB